MWRDRLATFTDRREALALFDHLRSRDPAREWPLLPILAFIAPGGSGKSTLIEYLRARKCSFGGRAAIPSAGLDFTLTDAPRDLLSILINLRDQLQRHDDGTGKHLLFPRFDLGTLVAQAAVTNPHAAVSGPGEVRQKLSDGKQFIEALNTLGSELGRAIPFVPALLAGLNLAGQIKPLRDLLNYLEDNTGWQWYHMHGSAMGLTASAGLKDALLRLQALSVPGRSEREWLVNEVLPAAFMADLAGCLLASDPPICWTKVTNVVIFLDGFEALQRSSASTASRLLQALATEPRRDGSTDPLLLVVGSRDYLPGMPAQALEDPLAQTTAQDEQEAKSAVQQLHARWQQQLPAQKRHLRSRDLYLTLWLRDFGWQDTRSYLLKLDERDQTRVFTADDALVETIERVTHGHPLSLALAAEAALEARARGRALQPGDFELAEVSPDVAPGHQDERVRDYLLDLFLRQVSESERKELIYCAVPRFLDPALLHVLLPALDDMDRHKRWDYYRRLTFVSATGDERVVFHPIVRSLLRQLLSPGSEPESDERRLHTSLREHFHNLAIHQGQPVASDWQAQVEEAYHALALGDPQPAIEVGIMAQRSNLAAWEPLLEAVAQAPVGLLSASIDQRAYDVGELAQRHRKVRDSIEAVVLYIWLITARQGDQTEDARLQHNLGEAYRNLPGGDRQTNLERAIGCFEAALQVRTRGAYPTQWAMTQNSLGTAYWDLPGGDRQANLERAISCYEAALQVRTREAYPANWAMTQINLGVAYNELPGGDKQANQERAIGCYEAVLQVYTREVYPAQWALTQNNLGNAYKDLPGGDRQANLERAIGCYEAALQVRTREAYPADWAMTQINLGEAYRNLPRGGRQANLERAISCNEAALQVYTLEAYPADWAATQNNLGAAYYGLPGGDRQANLERAISCYEAALQVRTREAYPANWAMTQINLGVAYNELPGGDKQANQERAIGCYEAALQVYTQEVYPAQWALTQNNLGNAYKDLPGGDRQANLERAIGCYEAALQVRTREAYPADWAATQNNLGNAHKDLPGGDRQANLERAIGCYEAALQVRTREAYPADWAMTQNNLGAAYYGLPGGDKQANLERAINYYEAALQICRALRLDHYAQVISGNLEKARSAPQALQ